jgi:hypothetical protein
MYGLKGLELIGMEAEERTCFGVGLRSTDEIVGWGE